MSINKEWTFTNTSIGPDKWKDKYSKCNTSYQSPINIITRNVVRCEMECNIEFQYFTSKCKIKALVNQQNKNKNTRSIIFYLEYDNGSYIIFNGVTYVLQTIYFFPGGLHTIDEGKYDMEAVLNHTNQSGKTLNISILISRSTNFGDSQNFFSQWANNLVNLSKNKEIYREKLDNIINGETLSYNVDDNWSINNLLPLNRSFYYYLGSGVFPPCNSDIKWLILKESVDILYSDLKPFIEFANKTFEGSDGTLYSEPLRNIQPNPSFVSGKKIERIVYENNNSNNGNIKKEKIYIKCQRVNKKTNNSEEEFESSEEFKKKHTGFFNSNLWKLFKYICYISLYLLAIFLAYKFVNFLYKSGKINSLNSNLNNNIQETNIDTTNLDNNIQGPNTANLLKDMLEIGKNTTIMAGGGRNIKKGNIYFMD